MTRKRTPGRLRAIGAALRDSRSSLAARRPLPPRLHTPITLISLDPSSAQRRARQRTTVEKPFRTSHDLQVLLNSRPPGQSARILRKNDPHRPSPRWGNLSGGIWVGESGCGSFTELLWHTLSSSVHGSQPIRWLSKLAPAPSAGVRKSMDGHEPGWPRDRTKRMYRLEPQPGKGNSLE